MPKNRQLICGVRIMKIYSPLYGNLTIPDTKEEILEELKDQRELFAEDPCRYRQAVIDSLEEGLEIIRMREAGLDV